MWSSKKDLTGLTTATSAQSSFTLLVSARADPIGDPEPQVAAGEDDEDVEDMGDDDGGST
jgi:hypothetical protein